MEQDAQRKCNLIQKLCYGMGHVYNDLCAAMWFSYTLFYLQIILQMESKTAGILIMIGTLSVLIGFTLLFWLKPSSLNIWIIICYSIVISLFQIGWAVTQISHLSMIPDIATTHAHILDLTSIRYIATVCCNIIVYIITLIILKDNQNIQRIGPDDFYKFQKIAIIISLIGLLSSAIFYCGTTENTNYQRIPDTDLENSNSLITNKNITNFLKSSITYKVALMYMASRLFTTLNLIYIPLYLDERAINMEDTDSIRKSIATVPLVSFIASFLTTIFLKFKSKCCGDKLTYLSGIILALIGSLWISFSSISNKELYSMAFIIGISGSSTMISSLCLTAEFVKSNGFGGGSVYSTVTFTDKLISGGVVLIVQNLQCNPKDLCPNFYKHVLSYVCGGVSIIGLISLCTLQMCNRQ